MSDSELEKIIKDFVEASISNGVKEALDLMDYLLERIPPDLVDVALSELSTIQLLEFGKMLGTKWKEVNQKNESLVESQKETVKTVLSILLNTLVSNVMI